MFEIIDLAVIVPFRGPKVACSVDIRDVRLPGQLLKPAWAAISLKWLVFFPAGSQLWSKAYPACGGSQQSPIDLRPSETSFVEDMESFRWFGYSNDLTGGHKFNLINNGHTGEVIARHTGEVIDGKGLNNQSLLLILHSFINSYYSTDS